MIETTAAKAAIGVREMKLSFNGIDIAKLCENCKGAGVIEGMWSDDDCGECEGYRVLVTDLIDKKRYYLRTDLTETEGGARCAILNALNEAVK